MSQFLIKGTVNEKGIDGRGCERVCKGAVSEKGLRIPNVHSYRGPKYSVTAVVPRVAFCSHGHFRPIVTSLRNPDVIAQWALKKRAPTFLLFTVCSR